MFFRLLNLFDLSSLYKRISSLLIVLGAIGGICTVLLIIPAFIIFGTIELKIENDLLNADAISLIINDECKSQYIRPVIQNYKELLNTFNDVYVVKASELKKEQLDMNFQYIDLDMGNWPHHFSKHYLCFGVIERCQAYGKIFLALRKYESINNDNFGMVLPRSISDELLAIDRNPWYFSLPYVKAINYNNYSDNSIPSEYELLNDETIFEPVPQDVFSTPEFQLLWQNKISPYLITNWNKYYGNIIDQDMAKTCTRLGVTFMQVYGVPRVDKVNFMIGHLSISELLICILAVSSFFIFLGIFGVYFYDATLGKIVRLLSNFTSWLIYGGNYIKTTNPEQISKTLPSDNNEKQVSDIDSIRPIPLSRIFLFIIDVIKPYKVIIAIILIFSAIIYAYISYTDYLYYKEISKFYHGYISAD